MPARGRLSGSPPALAVIGRLFAVVPAYRAGATLRRVILRLHDVVDAAIVVDDACPERCTETIADLADGDRVIVLKSERNGGVGAATKAGIAEALSRGADFIVKVDSDDQMDTRYIPYMKQFLLECPDVDMVKGNRFADAMTLKTMPLVRLIGNAGLTLLVKFSSGYWSIVDPTNGYFMLRASAARRLDLRLIADRYFFEIDLLCALGLRHRTIAELEMPAIYGNEKSSLSISHVLLTFPAKLLARFVRRIALNYLVVEINVGSLFALIGFPLLLFGTIFGAYQWSLSIDYGESRPTGTIMLALLTFMLGFQLVVQALMYDIQTSTRTVKLFRDLRELPEGELGGAGYAVGAEGGERAR
jgi:dolichol-phosphate mannosyltransferase